MLNKVSDIQLALLAMATQYKKKLEHFGMYVRQKLRDFFKKLQHSRRQKHQLYKSNYKQTYEIGLCVKDFMKTQILLKGFRTIQIKKLPSNYLTAGTKSCGFLAK